MQTMKIHFTKAHACGNDFLVVERDPALGAEAERALAVALCARTTGVGGDGVEFLTSPDGSGGGGRIRLYNADGSVAEISGNGTRCVAATIAYERGTRVGEAIVLETDAGLRVCTLVAAGDGAGNGACGEGASQIAYQIATAMGVPTVRARSLAIDEEGIEVEGAVVSTGNPHFVVFVEDESFRAYGLEWQVLGRAICVHPDFPAQTNVEFVHVRAPGEIAIRIFERGVGPTSSSGTGTCAASAAAIALRGCAAELVVEAPGGAQTTTWRGPAEEMHLTGPARIVARGEAWVELGIEAGTKVRAGVQG